VRLCGEPGLAGYSGSHCVDAASNGARIVDVPMYQVDAIVRRAPSLQRTAEGRAVATTY
jgi:hypothetical protein